jgi:hypothetical protein
MMMSDPTDGPLESGHRQTRYIAMSGNGTAHGHDDTLPDARDRLAHLPADLSLYVVREDRTVVPDAVDTDTLGVADLAAVHEALTADHAILTGEADELDARRPHPPQYAFLYDVADGLRYRAERSREVRERELESGEFHPDRLKPTDSEGIQDG